MYMQMDWLTPLERSTKWKQGYFWAIPHPSQATINFLEDKGLAMKLFFHHKRPLTQWKRLRSAFWSIGWRYLGSWAICIWKKKTQRSSYEDIWKPVLKRGMLEMCYHRPYQLPKNLKTERQKRRWWKRQFCKRKNLQVAHDFRDCFFFLYRSERLCIAVVHTIVVFCLA